MRGTDPYTPHRGDPSYGVEHYDLDLDYRVSTNALKAVAVLTVRAALDLAELELDLVGLQVSGVDVDGRAARYRHRLGRLLVVLPGPAPAGAALTVTVRYAGAPAPVRGPWGEVGWEELEDGVLVAGQPDGAPTWFPCNDRPGDKASFRTTVRVPTGYAVAATGVLAETRVSGSRTTSVFVQEHPTAAYLASLQVGRYDARELAAGPVRQLLLAPRRLLVPARSTFEQQPRMVEVFSRLFGPAPFPQHTVVVTDDDLDIPLEAQGMAVFGANHVGSEGDDRLVAHELAHQWFGNSLTAASWRHVWLHEGFACYAEWLWSEESGGPTAHALARSWHRSVAARPQDLVLSDPGPADMFDSRVYERGALALHALRCALGEGGFWALLHDWVQTHRHGSVTTAQFVDLAAEHGGDDVRALLHAWLDLTPLPALPR